MPHFKLTLAYDGSHYHGWQIQPNLPTIQGTLAEALRELTNETVLPQGSGRTDAGVHALGQVASVTLAAPIPTANLHRALNRILPAAIRILSTETAPPNFHARHSARAKTYEYRIFERRTFSLDPTNRVPRVRIFGPGSTEHTCSPFLAPYVWDCRWPLDLAAMQTAALAFLGTHDFTSFAASDPDLSETTPNPQKTIHSTTWHHEKTPTTFAAVPRGTIAEALQTQQILTFRVTGSGFLHHMVRNMVGTLIDIGRGRIPADAIPGILAVRDRSAAGPTAPPQGLFLVSVDYASEPTQ